MLKKFRAQMKSSVAFLGSRKLEGELRGAIYRAVYKLVIPGTVGAGYLDCNCIGPRQLVDNCPYHGLPARGIARG